MTDTKTIRESFEQNLVDVLQGRPLLDKTGAPLLLEDGRVAVVRASAADLSVVRAYLKDLEDEAAKPKTPQTGQAKGVLKDFLESRPGLPFGSRPQ